MKGWELIKKINKGEVEKWAEIWCFPSYYLFDGSEIIYRYSRKPIEVSTLLDPENDFIIEEEEHCRNEMYIEVDYNGKHFENLFWRIPH